MANRTRRRYATAIATGALLGTPCSAFAAGWDTPIVHTARHQGMGGTAIGFVDDPSASFHNPAGYQGVRGLEVIGSFSLLFGSLQASPAAHDEATNVQSDPVVAPFPLVGVGARLHEWVTVGLGAYPAASGAASYTYPALTGGDIQDRLRTVFLEISPGASLNIPAKLLGGHRLAVGAGYRVTSVSFTRFQASETNTILDLNLNGFDYSGFRVGAQYSPVEMLSLGVVYRNKIEFDASAEEGIGLVVPFQDPTLGFVLPSKLGVGARLDLWRLGLAVDYEHAWQSENTIVELSGIQEGDDEPSSIDNHFLWQNGHTLRLGAEYRVPLSDVWQLPLRVGYVFDSQVGNSEYPTPFGTPPTATHSMTAGAGLQSGEFQVNLAAAYRTG